MITIDLLGEDDLLVGVSGTAPRKPQEPAQAPRRAPRELEVVVVPNEPEKRPKNPFLGRL